MSKIYNSNKKHGTMAVGIPKKIMEAMGWKPGDYVSWVVMGRDKLKVEKEAGKVWKSNVTG